MDTTELRARFQPIVTSDPVVAGNLNKVRSGALDLAIQIDSYADDGRAKSTAITKLEEAVFWANRAIAESAGSQRL